MHEPILGFFGQYRWLSNFTTQPILLAGEVYPTIEHAFQAAKTLDVELRRDIANCATPGQAKIMGRLVSLRPDWESVKEKYMYTFNLQKYQNNKWLLDRLLATGYSYLEATNSWGDTYWGVCEGVGKNRLGFILMEIRNMLRQLQ